MKCPHWVGAVDLGNRTGAGQTVEGDLLGQGRRILECSVGSDEGEELDQKLAAIKVAGETHEVNLEKAPLAAEGRARSDIGRTGQAGPWRQLGEIAHPHGVDAVARIGSGLEFQV